MSDLYDSLEDDCDRKNSLSDSPGGDISNTWVNTPESKNTPKTAFYLSRNGTGQESNLSVQNGRCAPQQKKKFLPKIQTKGLNGSQNLIVDTKILQAQGLQLNIDGSFSKSPRKYLEELPFITREYRNLQFQKQKTYKMVKKTSSTMIRNKMFSYTKIPEDGISMNKTVSGRREKRSSEEMLTSANSVSSRPREPKQLLPRENMTDSMKEKLLLSQGNTSSGTSKIVGDLRKTKRIMNLLDIHKTVQKNRFARSGGKIPKGISVGSSEHFPGKNKKGRDIKLQSDVPANSAFKPTLSYAEQRQRENGFNPLKLRLENKTPLSESDRSNFGDSIADRLSEISSRVVSSKNLEDEDEELFYKKLMESDQKQTSARRSSRSEGPFGITKPKDSAESGSVKDQNMQGRHNVKLKPISKSLSIDLQPETDGATQTLKKNHYCSVGSSTKLSRCELAMKAKTYGYLVNARNIFKLKALSEARMSPKEGDINDKSIKSSSNSEKPAENSRPVKDPSRSVFPKVEGRKSRGMDKPAGTKKMPKRGESPNVGVRGVVLPPVVGSDERDTKIQTEILNQMSMCLNSANGEVKDGVIDV